MRKSLYNRLLSVYNESSITQVPLTTTTTVKRVYKKKAPEPTAYSSPDFIAKKLKNKKYTLKKLNEEFKTNFTSPQSFQIRMKLYGHTIRINQFSKYCYISLSPYSKKNGSKK